MHPIFNDTEAYIRGVKYFGAKAAAESALRVAQDKHEAAERYAAGMLEGFNVLTHIERSAERLEALVKGRLFGTAQKMKEREAAGGNSPSVKQSHDDGLALMQRLFPTAQH